MDPKEELLSLERQLSGLYLDLSDKYKLMSKVRDNYRLNIMQSGIDQTVAQVVSIRERIDALVKEIGEVWVHLERKPKRYK